jgi:hypothetical protein
MKDVQDHRSCIECHTSFLYGGNPVGAQCPSCDSPNLTRFIRVQDRILLALDEYLILQCKDPSLPSRRKLRREVRTGRRPEGSGSGRLVDELRVKDSDLDHYEERIVDAESGRVLREMEEPLSTHRGGSEKIKKAKKDL